MKKFKKPITLVLSAALACTAILSAYAATTPEPIYEWQKQHQAHSRQMESEAILLLKNEDNILPLDAETNKIAVFGEGQVSPPGGGGSGGAAGSFTSNLIDGLQALDVEYFTEVTEYTAARTGATAHGWETATEYPNEWGENAYSGTGWNRGSAVQNPEVKLDDGLISDDGIVARARAFADTAVVYISRQTGVEEMDRHPEPQNGDWYLNASERVLLEQVSDKFDDIILVYVGTAPIDLAQFNKYDKIKAFVTEYGAGQFHGLALADILFGEVNPSAKLNDTLVWEYDDHPTNDNWGYTSYATKGYDWEANKSLYGSRKFSENDPISAYEEYIYMGYKYFDTFDAPVAYPFGFGLSYADFTFSNMSVTASQAAKNLTVTATINNVSEDDVIGGKEVMQVYVSKPQGKLEQPYQNLVSYDKTQVLESGESQTLSLDIDFYDFSSYDEELAAYVLEAGDYVIRVGNSSRNTHVAGKFRVEETIIVDQLSNQLSMQEANESVYEHNRLKYANATPITYDGEANEIANAPVVTIDASYVEQSLEVPENPVYDMIEELPEGSPTYKFNAVLEDEITLGQFVSQLTDEELIIYLSGGVGARFYINGQPDSSYTLKVSDEPNIPLNAVNSKNPSPSGAGSSRAINRLGIPSMSYADGGSGIGFSINGTRSNTGWPRPAAMACTWNPEGYYLQGVYEGREMVLAGIDNWLAPSINMHRNPLGGRNLEYWSEDPMLVGIAVSNLSRGVEEAGVSVCLKHFAANDQEWYRRGFYTPASEAQGTSKAAINVIAPERVIRELYLKPFEMAVKTGSVYNVMSAFNSINSQACASSPELLINILRGEWGFVGYVVTDWGDYDDIADSAMEMAAGNDMIMSGTHTRYIIPEELAEGFAAGRTNRNDLLRNTYNVLVTAMHSSIATDPSRHHDPGELQIVTTMLVDAQVGEEYSNVKVSPLWANGSADASTYTFSLDDSSDDLPNGIALAPNGQLSGVPAVGTEGEYALTFKVTDDLGNIATKELTLTVTGGLVFETTSLPGAKVSSMYNQQIVVSGNEDTLTYTVSNGTLPSGIYLTEEGVLTGAPTAEASGLYTFTITAADGTYTKSQSYTLYVEGLLDTVPAAGSTLTAQEGVAFSQAVTISGGVSNTLSTFEVSNLGDQLPDGLTVSIDTANNRGIISGTPASGSAGTYNVYILVDEEFAGSPVLSYVHYQIVVQEKEAVDKTSLQSVIEFAEELIAEGALENTMQVVVDEFNNALAHAKEILADSDATEEDVRTAASRMWQAIGKVDWKNANKSALAGLIADASAFNLDLYVEAGKAAFKTALDEAIDVMEDSIAFQEEVDQAYTSLFNAMKALRMKADKEALRDMIAQAQALLATDLSKYTDDSVARLQTAVNAGITVLNNEELSIDDQPAVNTATKNIADAMKLTLKDGSGSSDNGGSSEPSGSSAPSDGNGSGSGSSGKGSGSGTTSPKTADTSSAGLAMALVLFACGALVVIRKKSGK